MKNCCNFLHLLVVACININSVTIIWNLMRKYVCLIFFWYVNDWLLPSSLFIRTYDSVLELIILHPYFQWSKPRNHDKISENNLQLMSADIGNKIHLFPLRNCATLWLIILLRLHLRPYALMSCRVDEPLNLQILRKSIDKLDKLK